MRHARSNTNIQKKLHNNKARKTNIFKKSTINLNSNYMKSSNQTRKKNFLISLLEKNTPTNFNSKKYNFNASKNNGKEIYLTSPINSNNGEDKFQKRCQNGNINIRLNLNSEIINNNYNNSSNHNNFHKSKSNASVNEKIKEKDKLITKLQKELLQSQEFLNQLQKDKQNELIYTYNTIKKLDNIDKNFNRSLAALFNTPSLLKFNYSNQNKGNINKNDYNIFNSGFYSTKNRKYKISSFSSKPNYVRCFSSSHPRFFSYNLDNIDTYNLNFTPKNTFSQNSNINTNIILNHNSNPNLLMNKIDEVSSPNELYFTRQISYSNFNNTNNITNDNLIYKFEKLKRRTRMLLNNYITLIKENNCKNKKISN
jgi:hypothetical protein